MNNNHRNSKVNIYDNNNAPMRPTKKCFPYELNPSEFHSKFRKVMTNDTKSSLPQIAIKRKDNNSPSSSKTEVVLLNGNWDTSYKIPNIIAEMHNVNIEELQALKNTSSISSIGGANGGTSSGFGGTGCIKLRKLESLEYTMGAPSPLGSDSGIEGDCSDGNLSWLLNYKINELPPVPDCLSSDQNGYTFPQKTFEQSQQLTSEYRMIKSSPPFNTISVEDIKYQPLDNNLNQILHQVSHLDKPAQSHTYRYTGPKKPPFTYTELIEHALVEKGELTVSGIYQWISDHFPFYKQNDDRWKNSVRHNLSINPHFRKGSKAVHGAGHLWTIAQKEDQKTWNIKKQRMQQFMQTTMTEYSRQRQQEMELATATASILPDDYSHMFQQQTAIEQQEDMKDSKQLPQSVEVEYVIDMSGGLGDFLCPPVTKEQVVEECGLGGDYLITDLNPTTLGLNYTEAEIMNGTNLYDDLNFHCYELQTD